MCWWLEDLLMYFLSNLLAQIDDRKIMGTGEPPLASDASYGLTWMVVGLFVTLILLTAFKTSKRNSLDRQ
jgi:hypothetical protein